MPCLSHAKCHVSQSYTRHEGILLERALSRYSSDSLRYYEAAALAESFQPLPPLPALDSTLPVKKPLHVAITDWALFLVESTEGKVLLELPWLAVQRLVGAGLAGLSERATTAYAVSLNHGVHAVV
jgi:hypothetical protein